MNIIKLTNNGPADSSIPNLYFPRLQVNKHGEIVLALSRHGTMTTGILVGKTPGSKSHSPMGKKYDDWEVAGELVDYDGRVIVTLFNSNPTSFKYGDTAIDAGSQGEIVTVIEQRGEETLCLLSDGTKSLIRTTSLRREP